ncbi:MAG: MipA/OmpV family protein [Flavobacteriaceae bacterium]|nr:MipA/OmpV family protein [Flavobacteriaceae bacterium]
MKKCLYLLPVIVVTTGANIAIADEFGLGIGTSVKQKEYIGFDTETNVIPIVYYQNDYVRILGTNIDISLTEQQDFSGALRIKLGFGDGYDHTESPYLSGMKARENSVWIGPTAEYRSQYGTFSADILIDSLSESEGFQANLTYSRAFSVSDRIVIEPSISLSWLSKEYVDYYYGITQAEATADRPFYQADATLNMGASLDFKYLLSRHQQAWLGLSYNALGSEIKNSPIVDSGNDSRVGLFYLYRF